MKIFLLPINKLNKIKLIMITLNNKLIILIKMNKNKIDMPKVMKI
jgi:hypothetical protein